MGAHRAVRVRHDKAVLCVFAGTPTPSSGRPRQMQLQLDRVAENEFS